MLTFHWWQSCLKTKSYGKAIQRKPLSCGTKIKSFFPKLDGFSLECKIQTSNNIVLQTVYQVEERKKAKQNEDCLCNKQYIKKYGYHCICLENILKIKKCTMLVKVKPTHKHITRR